MTELKSLINDAFKSGVSTLFLPVGMMKDAHQKYSPLASDLDPIRINKGKEKQLMLEPYYEMTSKEVYQTFKDVSEQEDKTNYLWNNDQLSSQDEYRDEFFAGDAFDESIIQAFCASQGLDREEVRNRF